MKSFNKYVKELDWVIFARVAAAIAIVAGLAVVLCAGFVPATAATKTDKAIGASVDMGRGWTTLTVPFGGVGSFGGILAIVAIVAFVLFTVRHLADNKEVDNLVTGGVAVLFVFLAMWVGNRWVTLPDTGGLILAICLGSIVAASLVIMRLAAAPRRRRP